MFVTFEDPDAPINRNSAAEVHAALALWRPSNDDCFVEVTLPTTPGAALTVPTLADAGWYGFFVSAPPGARCGWTDPHEYATNPQRQPEAVRTPGSLAELLSSSDVRILPM
jgi:hypothetical protein